MLDLRLTDRIDLFRQLVESNTFLEIQVPGSSSGNESFPESPFPTFRDLIEQVYTARKNDGVTRSEIFHALAFQRYFPFKIEGKRLKEEISFRQMLIRFLKATWEVAVYLPGENSCEQLRNYLAQYCIEVLRENMLSTIPHKLINPSSEPQR